MSHHKDKYQEELTLYSLGLLKGYELRILEEHLGTGCEICLQALRENEMVLSSLPYSLDNSPLPPELENKIFTKIEEQESTHAVSEKTGSVKTSFWKSISPMWLNVGSAVAVGLLLILFVNNLSLRNEIADQNRSLESLQASLEKDTGMMDFMLDPNVETVQLAGAMANVEASGKLMWDKDTQGALLLVSEIPALKQGMEYQVWCVEKGKPVSLGTFTVNKKGQSMMEIDSMPRPSKDMQVLVTLEPEGGMPHPTGATYLVGAL